MLVEKSSGESSRKSSVWRGVCVASATSLLKAIRLVGEYAGVSRASGVFGVGDGDMM
jgi:hypothetical protein